MKNSITYKDAGVDIDAGDSLVEFIRPLARSTFRKEVKTDIGSFGGVIQPDRERFPDPLLVASTDGVGTKLRVAFQMDRHETIGQDLVAMCANDVLVHGAEPLFFLDYLATGKLEPDKAKRVIQGIADGCRLAGCALIGGETAEMPSFYPGGEYELAGFCVGIVNRDRLIEGHDIGPGDVLLGLPSNGLHSNGYSLVRKLFSEERGFAFHRPLEGMTVPLGEELLRPTRIYVQPVLNVLGRFPVKGLAHITGGGLTGNIPRILPEHCGVVVRRSAWPVPEIFHHIQKEGNLPPEEMLRTFNCGIGMVMVLSPAHVESVTGVLEEHGESCFPIGEVVHKEREGETVRWDPPFDKS